MDLKIIENIRLSHLILRSNERALLSIFVDSEEIRMQKSIEIEKEIEKWNFETMSKGPFDVQPLSSDIFNDYNHYHHHFDYLLLHSLFLAAFSLFENHLMRLVEIAENVMPSRIKFSDIKGQGDIDSMRKYFNLVHNMLMADPSRKEWAEILEYKNIRNAIIHNGNNLNKESKENPEKIRGYRLL